MEDVVDKIAIKKVEIDSDIATFSRVFIYCILVIPITILFGQQIKFYLTPGILFFGLASTLMSSAYTVVLKQVNITTIAILAYLAPILFLMIDNIIGHTFTTIQILAILGLVLSGIIFTLDNKLQFNKTTIIAFLIMFIYSATEYYYAKYMFKTEGLNVISLLANVWSWAGIFLLIYIIYKRKTKQLLTINTFKYMKLSILAKSFDSVTSVLWSIGILMTTTAQFSSFEVFFPPMMLMIALLVQGVLKIDIGESIERSSILRKTSMLIVIILCSIYV